MLLSVHCFKLCGRMKERKEKENAGILRAIQKLKNQLSGDTNPTQKMKRAKQKKNWWAIKCENGHKNPWVPSEQVRETIVGKIYGKGKFWVWSGTEVEWCTVKVVIMMMIINWWEKDEMTVTETHHRQVGEVLWEVRSRDEVRHGRKIGCWLSKRNIKVNEHRARVTTSEEWVLWSGWREIRSYR